MHLSLLSPAKVNLFLRILKRRPDGYHELATLLQAIGLYDTLSFEFDETDSLTCNDHSIPSDHSNLVLKAADLFRRKTGRAFGIKVHLEKKIPAQAGLGGGSGNAATTLWALNQLCGEVATPSVLREWAAEIGSDISFFFSQGTAYCTGRGEFVEDKAALPAIPIAIVKPYNGLSTPLVYRNLNLAKLSEERPQDILNSFWTDSPHYVNDLEDSAFCLMPELVRLREVLFERGFKTVLMAGSGSSLFCLGEGDLSGIENAHIFTTQFCQRKENQWYGQYTETH